MSNALSVTSAFAVTSLLWLGAASAQSIVLVAGVLPIAPSKHIAVAAADSAIIGVFNGCALPVDIEVNVSPYPSDGVMTTYEPYTIPLTIYGQGFQYGEVHLPAADAVSHADIEIVPASTDDAANACFAPGQDLIRASVGVFTSDGFIRNVFPIKFQGPSDSSDNAGVAIQPLHDRIVVRRQAQELLPVNPGDVVEIAAANDCTTAQKTTGAVLVVNAYDNPLPFEIDLDPGERKIISLVPVDSAAPAPTEGYTAPAGAYWVLVDPSSARDRTRVACSNVIRVGFIYKSSLE
jgi:hypothetical protein